LASICASMYSVIAITPQGPTVVILQHVDMLVLFCYYTHMHKAYTTSQATRNTTCASAILFNYTESSTMQNTLNASLSANYLAQFEDMYAKDMDIDDIAYELTLRFEREFAEYLRGCDSEDVGAVIVYLRGGEEVAFFDYENFHGSVYALGHKRASETSVEWAERVGAL
jgi:hypothetical protein